MKKTIIICLCIPFILLILYPVGYFVLPSPSSQKTLINLNKTQVIQPPAPYQGVISFVINLERSKQRLVYIKDRITALNFPFKRIEAVDGSKLTEQEIHQYVDMEAYTTYIGVPPKAGVIGCSLSHIHTWKTFLESSYEYALIFEDDVSFDPQILKQTIEELKKLNDLWDIVNFETHHRGWPLKITTLSNGQHLCAYGAEVTHTGAYLINRKAALKLLEKSLPIVLSVDQYFIRGFELDLKFTGIENPRLVHQTFGESEIDASKTLNQSPLLSTLPLIKQIKRRCYKVQSSIIMFLSAVRQVFFS